MLLTIDVGNTNAVFAIHDGEKFIAEWRCSSDYRRTADEYFVWLRKLMDHEGVPGTINESIRFDNMSIDGFRHVLLTSSDGRMQSSYS